MKIAVRISDNVLEDKDYGVRVLEILRGVVVNFEDVKQGVYHNDFLPTIGWTIEQIEKWSQHDSTGSHPENYHEVMAWDWNSFVTIGTDGSVRESWRTV